MKKFDLLVIGGGPGGYIAAIKGAKLGKNVAIIEKDKLGGVCLNRGCIPTKALMKSAHSVHQLKELKNLGINVELNSLDATVAVKRANSIADRMGKGIDFLMKKNKIEVFSGVGKICQNRTVEIVTDNGDGGETTETVEAENIIIATGASYKSFPGLVHDGERLIGAWEALKMTDLPESIAIVGAGAIGVEFAYFWNAFGVKVHIFELKNHLMPMADQDSSIELERAYRKYGIKSSLGIISVSAKDNGNDENNVTVTFEKNGEVNQQTFDKCLIAVGMTGNISDIGLENIGVEVAGGFISVDEKQETNVSGIYAIGDVSGGALLAHAASHEGIVAVQSMFGIDTHPIEPSSIPACTYCYPQIASIGYTEDEVKERGIKYSLGKAPFRANGKAVASNEKDGFIKIILGGDQRLLGAHIVGEQATELIHEYVLFKSMKGTVSDMANAIHPHPTLGEWLPEAVLAADGLSLNF